MWSPEPCNFDKNELHGYIFTIFTTDFRTVILCRTAIAPRYDVNRRKKCLKILTFPITNEWCASHHSFLAAIINEQRFSAN